MTVKLQTSRRVVCSSSHLSGLVSGYNLADLQILEWINFQSLVHLKLIISFISNNVSNVYDIKHESTRVPVCCWSLCIGAQIPASCVLACYWSMAVCYWGSSQSQTTTQLAGFRSHYMGTSNTGTLVRRP